MSWMDSWSRPSKSQAVPAPYYLSQNPEQAKYCHTCGRIIGSRRSNTSKSSAAEVKYCSDRCKRSKPSTAPDSLEGIVETALLALLEGREPPPPISEGDSKSGGKGAREGADGEVAKPSSVKPAHKAKKGDPRLIIALSELEIAVFGNRKDPEKKYGRRKNRAFRGIKDGEEWKSVDMVDRPKQQPPHSAQGSQPSTKATSQNHKHDKEDEDEDEDDYASLSNSEPDYDYDSDSSTSSSRPQAPQAAGGVPLTSPSSSSAAIFPPSNPSNSNQPHPNTVHLHHHRAPQSASDVNFSVGGERGWSEKISETPAMLAKRREGQKRAEEKEFVKRVARRAVVFGLLVDGDADRDRWTGGKAGGKGKGKGGGRGGKGGGGGRGRRSLEVEGEGEGEGKEGAEVRRKCEAIMQGAVVEPSFAKGDWQIRWRED